jgi:hypothetical protein
MFRLIVLNVTRLFIVLRIYLIQNPTYELKLKVLFNNYIKYLSFAFHILFAEYKILHVVSPLSFKLIGNFNIYV